MKMRVLAAGLAAGLLWPVALLAENTTPAPQTADVQAQVEQLAGLLDIAGNVAVMRQEGLAYGITLNADLLGGKGGAGWDSAVSTIYDAARMQKGFMAHLTQELAGTEIGDMLDFYRSDLGQRVVGLELSARTALLDPAVEEVAGQMRDQMVAEGGARHAALAAFIADNDLDEQNVTGAMNANFAFYTALAAGGGVPGKTSQAQILSDVWSQEADIRKETIGWLLSYLGMAYQPLSDDDLRAYAGFSRSAAGQNLNRAMFAAFDRMFTDISRDLGAAAARVLTAQEL